jgi:hypothetical protein
MRLSTTSALAGDGLPFWRYDNAPTGGFDAGIKGGGCVDRGKSRESLLRRLKHANVDSPADPCTLTRTKIYHAHGHIPLLAGDRSPAYAHLTHIERGERDR